MERRKVVARALHLPAVLSWVCGATLLAPPVQAQIGQELAVPQHLADGEEFTVSLQELIAHGQLLFSANWTAQEGQGRPLTKGNGNPVVDPTSRLEFPRNFNRISAPDANSCFGCHNVPRAGGGGDIVANVFVLGQRFDFATFDNADLTPTRGGVDESGAPVLLQTIANSRNTLGMFGSGYIEMLARSITADLQAIRDGIAPGGSAPLTSKGISFGVLARDGAGNWDTSGVTGLPFPSVSSSGPASPPNLIVRPFHQASNVVSVRQFSNNAFNHHHGIQSTERFGIGTDPDDDGFIDEMTRADVTAAAIFQATLPVPGRVIPNDPDIEAAILLGEQLYMQIGCASCHIPGLRLDNGEEMYVEPNPYNPAGNLRPGEAPDYVVNLNDPALPLPRLRKNRGRTIVPAMTDLRIHDITTGPGDGNVEALDMNQTPGTPEFFAGNPLFMTRKLWGIANEPPFFHHGQYTTIRQAIEAHHGEAQASFVAYSALTPEEQDALIEAVKSLRVLPEGTAAIIIDEDGNPKTWPPGNARRGAFGY